MSSARYDFRRFEPKWQARWDAADDFRAELYPDGPTYFVLVFPPYPNGKVHMGHVRNYTIGDAVARYKRMCGASVLHPIGFDAFGLPNELEAAKERAEPEQLTRRNIKTMERQLRRLGYSYDWKRKIVTIEPDYYKWNQWLFLELLERDLAYRKAARVQWCPSCKTSLANEQVLDGHCWRCEAEVVSRHLNQWFYRLRAYAEEIWAEAPRVFPDNIATMVRDWIGKTPGADLDFPVQGGEPPITVFTTKPELAYGATYLALSPEHPRAAALVAQAGLETARQQLVERVHASPDPAELTDGLDTGRRALQPLTGESIPIWLAAYVDPEFGTGAVMGNPCHDRADDTFGRRHGLSGKAVVSPDGSPWDHAAHGPYVGDGLLYDCRSFNGRPALEARPDVVADWEARGIGKRCTIFAVRDWLISRQRGWGVPIPVVHCTECGQVPVAREQLPVRIPEGLRATGEGNPLLQRPDFLDCSCPRCRRAAQRETDTMDTFLDTAWYYLRSMNPDHAGSLCDPRAVERWGQADLYVGGIEIAVPIMLYGSFVAKGLREAGHVDFSVPCRQLLAHDMVLNRGRKMSKSLGNTVDPEELVEQVGADSVRLLILSLAPPLKKIEWSDSRLRGCHKFLQRVWSLGLRQAERAGRIAESDPPTAEDAGVARRANEVIRAVTRDMERLQPNTCITELIKFLYELEDLEQQTGENGANFAERPAFHRAFSDLLVMLSAFAPHLCEELWERMGHPTGLSKAGWPRYDADLASRETTSITVKVNAKPVVRLEVPAAASREEVLALVHQNQAVRERIDSDEITKEVYVPGQIVNIVTSAR